MTQTIPLTQGKVALVDDDDFARLARFRWRINSKGYAIRSDYATGKEHVQCMHRLILDAQRGQYVDHINGDKLLNTRANLRLCTASQNLANRGLFSNSTTGFIGVSFEYGHWRAHIQHQRRSIALGVFADIKSAALARDHAAQLLFGPFARLNLPDQAVPDDLRQLTQQHLIRAGYRIVTAPQK